MNWRRSLLPLLLFTTVLIVGGVGIFIHQNTAKYGRATVEFQLPDRAGLSVKFNNQPSKITGLSTTFRLRPGFITLLATKPGYKEFLTHFTIKEGEELVINVVMQPSGVSDSAGNQQGSLVPFTASDLIVRDTVYFYDNSWVFAKVMSSDGNNALIVAKLNPGSRTWNVVLGPGTLFISSQLKSIPSNVTTYLYNNNYVAAGD